ncbi:ankyrin [Lojkania enalia]|uniref:Ankyrin n=1 Tax=Lojkania enalia TaxID=147567 RepID=A0A9P4K879_9PLEO|nr:ankyrin [Didymosphaeria enalia]
MGDTASEESYTGERVPTYNQTQSEQPQESLKGEESQPDHEIAPSPRQGWRYHNLDTNLLEFLCFLAEYKVDVVKKADLTTNEQSDAEEGTSLCVYRGRWGEKDVVLKYPKLPGFNSKATATLQDERQNLEMFKKILKDLKFEIQIMAHVQHPNIVKLLAVSFEDKITVVKGSTPHGILYEDEIFSPCLIVEPALLEYSTLDKLFYSTTDLTLDLRRSLISDISCGLTAIHQYGITHGDVKDTNILLFREDCNGTTRIVAKIADFGSSGLESSREGIRGQSPYWAAPEILERPSGWEGLRQTPSADIYSFGLLAITIGLKGEKPFLKEADSYTIKMRDEAIAHVKNRIAHYVAHHEDGYGAEYEAFFQALMVCVDNTLALAPSKRLKDLSSIPKLFDIQEEFQPAICMATAVPYHSYGTEAHPGIKSLAPIVSDTIYSKLPLSFRKRLVNQIHTFKEASTDSQTLLTHLALNIKDDDELHDAQIDEEFIKGLLILRLSQPSPPNADTSIEGNPEDVGGFGQVYVREIESKKTTEPDILRHIREGDLLRVKRLIYDNPKLQRACIGAQWNGLHYAAWFDRPEFIPLFATGPDAVNINDTGGTTHRYTPLHNAAWKANPACVKALLALGARVDPKSMEIGDFIFTPLSLCIYQSRTLDKQRAADVIRLLLDAGASPHWRTKGLGFCHLLSQEDASGILLDIVLQRHPDLINQRTPSQQTPLHTAAGSRNIQAVKILIARGADVNARNIVNDTPLHNAYMSIGPSTRTTSSCYNEYFVKKLLGSTDDSREIIKLLKKHGADKDALGLDNVPWDTPEFRMYDEYEDASMIKISPAVASSPQSLSDPWSIHEWSSSEFDRCAVFSPGDEKLDLHYDLLNLTPNYYELQVRLAVLEATMPHLSITFLIYCLTQEDAAEVLMAARISLAQLDINKAFTMKLRGFVIKHLTNAKIHIYQENTPGGSPNDSKKGKIMLDWIAVNKFNMLTQIGYSTLTTIEGLDISGVL